VVAGYLGSLGALTVQIYFCCEVLVKILIFFVAWCILLVIAWPLAILALVLAPFVWLVALPLRLVGVVFAALLAFLRALLFLPAHLLGHRG